MARYHSRVRLTHRAIDCGLVVNSLEAGIRRPVEPSVSPYEVLGRLYITAKMCGRLDQFPGEDQNEEEGPGEVKYQ